MSSEHEKKIEYLKENQPNFIVIFVIILVLFFSVNTTAPINFPEGKLITVEKGETIKNTGSSLKKEGIIKSETMFNVFVTLRNLNVVEGKYLFHTRENIFSVINRVTTGSYQIPVEKITFIEGETSYKMAEKLKNKLPNFDVETFHSLAILNEGYLFPDTYEFRLTVSAEEVVNEMKNNFDNKISSIKEKFDESERSLDDIIKMASIVEGEASFTSRDEVADILWKRLDIDMPLQVDATFVYSIGKSTFDLTMSDLADEENPYNSYKFRGLPPTPINNPGIKAIEAALSEEETPYLFFLTGQDGEMYYSLTFDGHKRNRALYLN